MVRLEGGLFAHPVPSKKTPTCDYNGEATSEMTAYRIVGMVRNSTGIVLRERGTARKKFLVAYWC